MKRFAGQIIFFDRLKLKKRNKAMETQMKFCKAMEATAVKAKADAHAVKVLQTIDLIRAQGIIGASSIARELIRRRVPTARGGRWDASRVRVLLSRADGQASPC